MVVYRRVADIWKGVASSALRREQSYPEQFSLVYRVSDQTLPAGRLRIQRDIDYKYFGNVTSPASW